MVGWWGEISLDCHRSPLELMRTWVMVVQRVEPKSCSEWQRGGLGDRRTSISSMAALPGEVVVALILLVGSFSARQPASSYRV